MPTLGAIETAPKSGHPVLWRAPDCGSRLPDVVVAEETSSVGLSFGLFCGYAGCFAVEEGAFLG